MNQAANFRSGVIALAMWALFGCTGQAGESALTNGPAKSTQLEVVATEAPAKAKAVVTSQDQAQTFIGLLATHGKGLSWDKLTLGMSEADVARRLGGRLELHKSQDNPYADDGAQEYCGNHTVQALPVSLCFVEFEGARMLSGVALHLPEAPLKGPQIAQLKAFARQRIPELKPGCPDCELQRGHEMVAIKSAGLSWTVPEDGDADY